MICYVGSYNLLDDTKNQNEPILTFNTIVLHTVFTLVTIAHSVLPNKLINKFTHTDMYIL